MADRALLKRLDAARDFPHNTCPASRHAQLMGQRLLAGKTCHDIADDPHHAGESILLTVVALYEARAALVEAYRVIKGNP